MTSALRGRRVPSLVWLAALALLWSLPWSPAARAATAPQFDIERFDPVPDASAGFAVPSPSKLNLGQFALALTFDDELAPLVLETDNGNQNLVNNRLGAAFTGVVGLGWGFAFGIELPLVLYQGGSLSSLESAVQSGNTSALSATALGDPQLLPRFTLLNERQHYIDLAVEGGVTLPTGGASSSLSSDGAVGGTANLILGRSIGPVRILFEGGARFRPSKTVGRIPIGDEIDLRGTVLYALPQSDAPFKVKDLLAEVDGAVFLGQASPFASTNPAEWRVGVRFCAASALALTAGGGGGLTDAYGTPFARFILGIGYDASACARGTPNDIGPAQGAPRGADAIVQPPDSDGDGIPDKDDKCPKVKGDAAHHGCPAGAPALTDTDGDGVPDTEDRCPKQAGPAANQGCPLADRDHDGVADYLDECPDQPGPATNNGCPVQDRDHDGVPDDKDKCPDDFGDAEHDGCPFHDVDADGVPDEFDNCPRDAGTVANFGCSTPQYVELTEDRLIVLERILFQGNTPRIERQSYKVLDQVAAVLNAHQELTKIRIEGHTDNRGDSAENKRLSEARADAVLAYLMNKDVTGNRLDSVGIGGDQPIASNLNARGREANRRIEFVIVNRAQKIFVRSITDKNGVHYVSGPVKQPRAEPKAQPKAQPKAEERTPAAPVQDLALPDDLPLSMPTPAPAPPPAKAPVVTPVASVPAVSPPAPPPAAKPAPPPAAKPAPKPGETPSPNGFDLPPLDDLPPIPNE